MKKTAFCKINLTLEILGTKRGDGFHDLKTVMHKIPLGDIIELDAGEGSGNISLFCESAVCPPEENLAYRAAKAYLEKYRENTGNDADISVSLTKITPAGAGLGGGSADAAAVLDMLSEALCGVSENEILELAQKLGSDVPFCLERYTSALCTGRGEICRSIETLPRGTHIVVAKPLEGINTSGIYREYDKVFGDDYSKDSSEKMQTALETGELCKVSECLVNDFEKVCIPRLPAIQTIKDKMLSWGAVCSQMSGSGSAVFGLFDDEALGMSCAKTLRENGLKEVYFFSDTDFQKMYKGE